MNLKKITALILSAVTVMMSTAVMPVSAELTTENENQFSDGVVLYEKVKNGVKVVKCD